jgi:DNA-directed RNA polymerase subunit alpha
MLSVKDFSEMTIKVKESKKDQGVFVVGPLPKGYGHTLGNSLRRVLLSSLEGAAVTSVRFDGVKHEFSTIEGVLEDVVQIVLRIKSLKILSHTTEPQKISIKASGKGEVKSGDIKTTADVEVVDKNILIATLTDAKSKFEVDMIVEKGIGYQPANEELRTEVGVIPLDASFSPVNRVKLLVEPARVGSRTDFENVTLEILTDGLIEPDDAMSQGADILRKIFGLVSALGDVDQMEKLEDKAKEEAEQFKEEKATKEEKVMEDELTLKSDWEDVNINETNFPTRVKGALVEYGIETVGDLTKRPRDEVAEIPGIGEKSMKDLEEELKKMGLVLLG